jgi:precorrin-8X/cobalt-precorrin-8 methylmutase
MNPSAIERRSMEIIDAELAGARITLAADIAPIVRRVIHATADFSFAGTMRFSDGIVDRIRGMTRSGAAVVTDTNMALAGINKEAARRLNLTLACLMAEPDVAEEARSRGITRAAVSMERALGVPGPKLFVCGNAPTFLMPLLDRYEACAIDDIAVIGAPVGFVNVVETKERLWASGIPCVTAMGRRGGSGVAAAIVNALMYGVGDASQP